jgi:crotonobetaine/carnitine-CoA ligase
VFAPVDTFETGRDLWRWRVEATPERVFLRHGDRTWTFAEFDLERRRLAAGLGKIGVGLGTRVAVGLTNRPEMVAVQLALQELGAVYVPLLQGLTFAELSYPLQHSGATHLVVDGDVAATLLPAAASFERVERIVVTEEVETPSGLAVDRLGEIAAAEALAHVALPGHGRAALSMVLYTSGSTGRPKGVMVGAGSFADVGDAFADIFGLRGDDNFLLPMPLAHAIGALTALGIAVHTGCQVTLVDRFSPRAFWGQVTEAQATTTILFPAHLNLLLEVDDGRPQPGGHPLRLVITHAFIRRFRERFGVPLATVWGMTETGAICTGSEPGYEGELGENYVGTPMRGAEVAVFDEAFARLPHRSVMLGYLDQPDETAKTLVDGWIRSGDRGVVDEQGRVFFGGRFKNVIKRSGENISAEEVELALDRHPDVSECAVFGVADALRAEEVAAVLVVRPGSALGEAALRDSCRDALVRWKLPRYVVLREEPLPRLGNGKIDRVSLSRSFDPASAWDAESTG